jgi:tRNA A37 threonylcarbamoyltransferase TsaD
LRPVKKVYSTDNAAMIGVVGIMEHRIEAGKAKEGEEGEEV